MTRIITYCWKLVKTVIHLYYDTHDQIYINFTLLDNNTPTDIILVSLYHFAVGKTGCNDGENIVEKTTKVNLVFL